MNREDINSQNHQSFQTTLPKSDDEELNPDSIQSSGEAGFHFSDISNEPFETKVLPQFGVSMNSFPSHLMNTARP